MKLYVRPRWLVFVALAPLVVLGLLGSGMAGYGLVRYDPAYFTPAYQERYGTPAAVAKALERALQSGDRALLAELQGLRSPTRFDALPSIQFVMLWEYTNRYTTYLYFDVHSYQRYLHPVEEVRGRWVVAPRDLFYIVHSGLWKELFLPAASVWWASGSVLLAAVWLVRASPRVRSLLYGNWVAD